jgi:hypothetical protein
MTARERSNGNDPLQSAMVELIQSQAQFVKNQARFVSHLDEDRQRFTRIERDLDLIKALLLKHEETLQKLPEAIREKIGFQKT